MIAFLGDAAAFLDYAERGVGQARVENTEGKFCFLQGAPGFIPQARADDPLIRNNQRFPGAYTFHQGAQVVYGPDAKGRVGNKNGESSSAFHHPVLSFRNFVPFPPALPPFPGQ
jgi:hypothetical protein